ncbi:MAG: NAD-dependent epimerase/dehydratase family protein [Oscillatoriales cyanobacterium]|uniref:CIA30 family protein n=1 Tax=Microcoleus anatoxicus PTRS2 TaxID=2705321 RepID=A0ABU8YJU5_9CYAN|nr:MAG: NAD-dependent epimerase/dehydratase family protein [Oscillatoriales cyanobacterium]TAD97184.1 MAG: NAD-dependent epimerase/dehydratase family protein [Oscillatoriales cyanobacterium]TAE05048.1 MAG: NAD-dependent epimerase/dehydratase family protein [Oscillatoriales cyanobacterium]TAE99627.1 MAG: NAD-dependent epimerase/dehydratase family protein [Oscillatoriales cyanobacterium]TAF43340.1 MAG: NAD-dependent epimerase/dehydratase family protein [Oscillatoriales cyanobacterium]
MTEKNTAQWDAGRFVKTLAYFGVIPFIGSISWLQQLFGSSGNTKKDQPKLVLVAGATGGVGKRVVKRLQQRGIRVRALVRDSKRAQEILGKNVELVEADITLAETLTPLVTEGVEAVICCTGTRVQPVEGDTPNREKYYQGIKFYMPEVVDVPEIVEYKGVNNLVQAVRSQLGKAGEKTIFDFTKPTEDLKETWGALDDIVMGGVSESSIRLIDNTALFTGNVSTANSGGFASVRTRNFESALDLTGFSGIQLRVKGDGKRYKLIVRSEAKWDGIGYCYSFDTVYNIWITVTIPFEKLIPVFRAKTVKDGSRLNTQSIYSFQLMLSKFEYDGALNPKFTPGSFQLQLESVKAYSEQELPRFVMVSSAGVTRPGRPGINLEEEPPAVRMNDMLGGILTWKLKGEDCVRSSGIPYTVIRPCALTEELGGKALIFDQGDNIRGKVSREDIAQLCVEALDLPEACNVTFEVKEGENGKAPGDWEGLFSGVK